MDSRIRNLCITLSVLLLVGLIGYVIFWKVIQSRVEQGYTVEAAAKEDALHKEQEAQLKSVLTTIGPEIDTLSTRIVAANGTVALIDYIESLAKSLGATVAVSSVNVSPNDAVGTGFENLDLSLTTDGSWSQVYTFLAALESLPFKMTLSSVSLTQGVYDQSSDPKKPAATTRVWSGAIKMSVLKKK